MGRGERLKGGRAMRRKSLEVKLARLNEIPEVIKKLKEKYQFKPTQIEVLEKPNSNYYFVEIWQLR